MKFTILINQTKALEWQLNLIEAALFSYCYELPSWAEGVEINNKLYYYSARSKMINELPIITSKADTVYRLLKNLEEKELIETCRVKDKGYIRVKEKGRAWNTFENGTIFQYPEKIPNTPGKFSEPVKGDNPEIFPTYYNTNNNKTIDKGPRPPKSTPEEKIKNDKIDFCKTLITWIKNNPDKYPKLLYFDFAKHWLEESLDQKKLRFQEEKFFNIGKRLGTWIKRTDDKELDLYWQKEKTTEPVNTLLLQLL